MYNRYQGNTGRFVREGEPEPRPHLPGRPPAGHMSPPPEERGARRGPPPGRGGGPGGAPAGLRLPELLQGLLPRGLPDGLETEDLLLLLVLYLLYKDSGDRELLIILGAMFLT